MFEIIHNFNIYLVGIIADCMRVSCLRITSPFSDNVSP